MDKIGRSESFDYFSILPESVIHHILSFLPFKDIGRTSKLSKMWKLIWSSYPNISLDFQDEVRCTSPLIPAVYLGRMETVMDQCLFRKVFIQKFRLFIFSEWSLKDARGLRAFSPRFDCILGSAIARKASELVIEFHFGPNVLYSVPDKLVVAESLKVLDLAGCMFEDRFACINLPRLQKFRTYHCVFASENILSKILCGCPDVEFVEVSDCEGVGSFLSVSCKPRLKYFDFDGRDKLQRIEILAPSLETLILHSIYSSQPCVIELAGCAILNKIVIWGVIFSGDYTIQSLLSKLLCIEELKLNYCRVADKIQISSSCLKRLVISDNGCFPGAEIDIPNLLSLDFHSLGTFNPSNRFSSWNIPKAEDINMVFNAKTFQTACRGGLKGFLMQLRNYEDLRLVVKCIRKRKCIMHEKLHAVSYSSLNKLVKKLKAEFVVISSQVVEYCSSHMIGYESGDVSLSFISSSLGNIEILHKKLRSDSRIKFYYSDLRVLSVEDMDHEFDSTWKSFMNTHSTGYHIATMILIKKTSEEMFQNL
ncbi:unnamed protein product [Cuscuta europaea]|nr:unnamed protein product [Cuscuta europaea]